MLHTPETPLVENLGLNPALFEKVVAISNSIPAHQNLNIVLLTLAPGKPELLMTVGSEFANSTVQPMAESLPPLQTRQWG